MTGLQTKWGRDTYVAAARSWANASDPIYMLTDDGMSPSGFQVANFRHSPERALECMLTLAAGYEGMGEEAAGEAVEAALSRAEPWSDEAEDL